MAFDRNAAEDQSYGHKPVLLDECLDALAIKPEGIYLDGTLGRAGHSLEIARRLSGKGRLIGVDRDETALEAAKQRLAEYMDRVTLVHSNFSEIHAILDQLGIDKIDGMLFDLGVSSPQLDDGSRGFSYMADAPLDMRMNRDDEFTAYDVVNKYSEEKLADIFFLYGEEKYSRQIARKIVTVRETKQIETTLELVDIIKSALPAKAKNEKQHPAKRVFQAIRIEVNGELIDLENAVCDAIKCLVPGGRLAIITFHSLEDRIVKTLFFFLSAGCICSKDLPVCVCGNKPKGELVLRKPVTATKQELDDNTRSHSAKLRAIKKY